MADYNGETMRGQIHQLIGPEGETVQIEIIDYVSVDPDHEYLIGTPVGDTEDEAYAFRLIQTDDGLCLQEVTDPDELDAVIAVWED